MNKRMAWLIASLLLPLLATGEGSPYSDWPGHYRFVAFEVPGVEQPVAGRLSFPETGNPPWPAVIIAHGSGGVDGRGPLYARRLNNAGFVTLEVDMWSARGMEGGLDRPDHVRQTLPDAYAARSFLQRREDIDGDRIGLMGFSWGGVMAMLAAGGTMPEMHNDATPEPFGSLVALYPVCWGYNRVEGYELERIAAEDLLVIAGTHDDYDGRDDCNRLLNTLPEEDRMKAELLVLREATHGFDHRAPETLFRDPYARRGRGGEVRIRYNPAATKHSLSRVTDFFRLTLAPEGAHQPVSTGKPGQHATGGVPVISQ